MSWKQSTFLPTYAVNKSGASDWTGDWIPCRIGDLVIFESYWTAIALTAGVFSVQGTQDPGAPPATARVVTLPSTFTGYGQWPNSSVTAQSASIFIRSPFVQMRMLYTRTAGGAASQFQATVEIRS